MAEVVPTLRAFLSYFFGGGVGGGHMDVIMTVMLYFTCGNQDGQARRDMMGDRGWCMYNVQCYLV